LLDFLVWFRCGPAVTPSAHALRLTALAARGTLDGLQPTLLACPTSCRHRVPSITGGDHCPYAPPPCVGRRGQYTPLRSHHTSHTHTHTTTCLTACHPAPLGWLFIVRWFCFIQLLTTCSPCPTTLPPAHCLPHYLYPYCWWHDGSVWDSVSHFAWTLPEGWVAWVGDLGVLTPLPTTPWTVLTAPFHPPLPCCDTGSILCLAHTFGFTFGSNIPHTFVHMHLQEGGRPHHLPALILPHHTPHLPHHPSPKSCTHTLPHSLPPSTSSLLPPPAYCHPLHSSTPSHHHLPHLPHLPSSLPPLARQHTTPNNGKAFWMNCRQWATRGGTPGRMRNVNLPPAILYTYTFYLH